MPSNKVNFALVGEDETSRTSRHASISSDNATDSERETQIKAAQIALQKQALGPARMQRLRTSRVKEPQFFCGPRKRGKTGEEAAEVDSWTIVKAKSGGSKSDHNGAKPLPEVGHTGRDVTTPSQSKGSLNKAAKAVLPIDSVAVWDSTRFVGMLETASLKKMFDLASGQELKAKEKKTVDEKDIYEMKEMGEVDEDEDYEKVEMSETEKHEAEMAEWEEI